MIRWTVGLVRANSPSVKHQVNEKPPYTSVKCIGPGQNPIPRLFFKEAFAVKLKELRYGFDY